MCGVWNVFLCHQATGDKECSEQAAQFWCVHVTKVYRSYFTLQHGDEGCNVYMYKHSDKIFSFWNFLMILLLGFIGKAYQVDFNVLNICFSVYWLWPYRRCLVGACSWKPIIVVDRTSKISLHFPVFVYMFVHNDVPDASIWCTIPDVRREQTAAKQPRS